MSSIAITGFGVVSPLGVGREAFLSALQDPEKAALASFEGASEVLTDEVAAPLRLAEVRGFDARDYLGKKGLRNLDRLTRFMIVASRIALRDAGIKNDGEFVHHAPERVGISSATAYGSLDAITELLRVAELEAPRYINPARFPNTVINAAAGYVSIWEGLGAPNTTVVDGSCGALDAFLNAQLHLENDRGDVFLVGGGEVITEPLAVGLAKLGALGPSAALDSRVEESFCIGEGAAYFCVERKDEALSRGARLLACVRGYGTAFEPPANEVALVHGSSRAVQRAIGAALADAGLKPEDIDIVASGVRGLRELDAAELDGIRAKLGPDVAVGQPKQVHGETFGASGALALAQSIGWMAGAPLGTLLSGVAPQRVRTVLITSVGFYGNVSALIIETPRETHELD
jgi:3-oxoacyl-(acyl-carrier-protein) synthase